MMDYMTLSDILYILNQSTIQDYGTLSLVFL